MTTNPKPERYLTDIKALPEEPMPELRNEVKGKAVKVNLSQAQKVPSVVQSVQKEEDQQQETLQTEEGTRKFPLSTREMILVIINIFSVIFLIVLLTKIPVKAGELRQLRIQDSHNAVSSSSEQNQINLYQTELEALSKLYLDESGIVTFVNEVEKIKTPTSAIQKVTFTSQKAIKDRTGNFGIPVVIEMSGSWDQIGKDMEKIQVLPFLYRPVTFDAKPRFEHPEITDVKYGVLLYVKDTFVKEK